MVLTTTLQAVIPKGTYTGQKKDATTFGVKATVVTSADMVGRRPCLSCSKSSYLKTLIAFKSQHPAFWFTLEKKKT